MKTKMYLLVAAVMLTLAVSTTKAADISAPYTAYSKDYIATLTDEQKQARIEEIKDRVDAIKAMDKSELTRGDKKEIKAELKSMRHEAKDMNASAASGGNGIYLSLGAIIIIVLLLILIL